MGNGFLPQFGLHGNKKLVSCLATNNFYLFTIYFHNASKYYQQGAITYLGGGYGTLFPRPEAKIASFQQIIAKLKKKSQVTHFTPLYPNHPELKVTLHVMNILGARCLHHTTGPYLREYNFVRCQDRKVGNIGQDVDDRDQWHSDENRQR